MKDHNIAVKLVLDALMDAEHGVIKSTDEIAAVGQRVLHAGEKYIESLYKTFCDYALNIHVNKLILKR